MLENLKALLSPEEWARVRYYEVVGSTNTEAKALAAQGAPHGTVLIADSQTGGRGRLGRSFASPSGKGVYLSMILQPQVPAEQLMHLTCWAGVAACDAIEKSTGLHPKIKWINDLIYENRKIGGILTELGFDGGANAAYAVVGIGINCLERPEDFPPELAKMAGSLAMFTDSPVSRAQVAASLIQSLNRAFPSLLSQKEALMRRYRSLCLTLGREVQILSPAGSRRGTALDVTKDGALLVRFPDGHQEAVSAGEVSVRGMYGYSV